MDWPHGFDSFGGDHRVPLFYAQGSSGGGHYPVCEVLADGDPVGVEIIFSPRRIDAIDAHRTLLSERLPDAAPLSPEQVPA